MAYLVDGRHPLQSVGADVGADAHGGGGSDDKDDASGVGKEYVIRSGAPSEGRDDDDQNDDGDDDDDNDGEQAFPSTGNMKVSFGRRDLVLAHALLSGFAHKSAQSAAQFGIGSIFFFFGYFFSSPSSTPPPQPPSTVELVDGQQTLKATRARLGHLGESSNSHRWNEKTPSHHADRRRLWSGCGRTFTPS